MFLHEQIELEFLNKHLRGGNDKMFCSEFLRKAVFSIMIPNHFYYR